MLNLVVNARDAMPEGGRADGARRRSASSTRRRRSALVEGQAGRYARLSVSDTGTGIDEQTRAKLFEPFFTTKEQGKGTGLGLSIVYGIVKQSGGYITVVSEPGRGATFLIYLPIAAAPEPAAGAGLSRRLARAGAVRRARASGRPARRPSAARPRGARADSSRSRR